MEYDLKRGFWLDGQEDKAINLYSRGQSVFEIAPTVQKSPRQVYDMLATRGMVAPMPDRWPDEWHTELLNNYQDMSASNLAAHLSQKFGVPFTRNAVIGRLSRLKLKRHYTPPPPQPRKRKPLTGMAKIRASRPPAPKKILVPAIEPINGTGVPLSDLTFPILQCRWPTGRDERGMLCCGHPVEEGKSYCAYHRSVGTIDENTRPRPRKADRMGRFVRGHNHIGSKEV